MKNFLSGFYKLAASGKEVSAVAVIHRGKMLMGLRQEERKFTTPCGHIEGNETPVQGAVRELWEESGIKAQEKDLEFLKTIKKPDGYIIHGFRLDLKKFPKTTGKNDPDQEVKRWRFYDTRSIPDSKLHVPRNQGNVLLEALEKTAISHIAVIKAIEDRVLKHGKWGANLDSGASVFHINKAYNGHASPKALRKLLKEQIKTIQKRVPKSKKGLDNMAKSRALQQELPFEEFKKNASKHKKMVKIFGDYFENTFNGIRTNNNALSYAKDKIDGEEKTASDRKRVMDYYLNKAAEEKVKIMNGDHYQSILDEKRGDGVDRGKAAKDLIPGGLADKKSDKDFDPKSLKRGEKVESEHTSNKSIAKEIARDHLTEDPQYYEKLQKMEKKSFMVGFRKSF